MVSFEIKLIADPSRLREVDEVILATLTDWLVPSIQTFHFAVHEVVINAIQAGEKQANTTDDILLVLEKDDTYVQCHVTDYFGGMTLEDMETYVPDQEENGRGLMLIQHYVDEVKFEHQDTGAFCVHIKKKL